MIKELSDMPSGVIGFEASGKMRAEDYRDVVLPALERAAAAGEVKTFPLAQQGEAIEWVAS